MVCAGACTSHNASNLPIDGDCCGDSMKAACHPSSDFGSGCSCIAHSDCQPGHFCNELHSCSGCEDVAATYNGGTCYGYRGEICPYDHDTCGVSFIQQCGGNWSENCGRDHQYGVEEGTLRSSTPIVGVQMINEQCVPVVYVGMAGTLPEGVTPVNADGAWADGEREWESREGQTVARIANYFVALNGISGELVWAYFPDCGTIEGGGSFGPDGTIILQPWGCGVIAIDAATGAERWRYAVEPIVEPYLSWLEERSPGLLVTDSGLVVFHHVDNVAFASNSTYLVALDGSSGHVRWKSADVAACKPFFHCSNALAYGEQKIFVPNYANSTLAALNERTGALVWQQELIDGYKGKGLHCSTVSPQYDSVQGTVLVRTCEHVFVVDGNDGSLMQYKHFPGCASFSPGAIDHDGYFYFICESINMLAAVNAARHVQHMPIVNSYVNKYDTVDDKLTWISNGYDGGVDKKVDPFAFSGLSGGPTMPVLDTASNTLLFGGLGSSQLVAINATSGMQLWNVSIEQPPPWLRAWSNRITNYDGDALMNMSIAHMLPTAGTLSPIIANDHIFTFDGYTLTCHE